jgi:biopolymer transport protein TolR
MAMSAGGLDSEVKSEPNVIPMIDVMLVLLIIFMIVTPVITGGFRATMPQANNIKDRPDEENDIILGIDDQGNYYLDQGDGNTARIPNDSLEPFLVQLYTDREKDRILYFRTDQDMAYGPIEDAIEIAKRAGVAMLASVTEMKKEGVER